MLSFRFGHFLQDVHQSKTEVADVLASEQLLSGVNQLMDAFLNPDPRIASRVKNLFSGSVLATF